MTLSVSPTQSDSLTALRSFLLAVLPPAVAVVQGQGNRVPEPVETDFVVMTPMRRERIETNVDSFQDKAFTGSIADDQMTITGVLVGALAVGDQVSGANVAAGTKVLSGPGAGGVGVYTVEPAGQTVASTTLQAGAGRYLQPTKVTVQLDVHGPSSADNAQTISTMFRDDYAVQFFADANPNVVPLYADDPRQMPFENDQQQVEDRWVIDALMQVNATVIAPQQFADKVDIGLINVDATYPP